MWTVHKWQPRSQDLRFENPNASSETIFATRLKVEHSILAAVIRCSDALVPYTEHLCGWVGRYTYEMGVALHASSNPADQELWKDW